MFQSQRLDIAARGFANNVEFALQRILHNHIAAATDKHLAHERFFFTHGGRHGHIAVDRHIAPTEQHLAFGFNSAFHFLLASEAGSVFLGQENHAHAVFAQRWQLHALFGHFFAVKGIGNLNQDTSAVAHQLVRTHCAPMVEIFENLQGVFHNSVRFRAFDVRNKAHAASVVLLGWGIQTVFLNVFNLSKPCHGVHSGILKKCQKVSESDWGSLLQCNIDAIRDY